MKNLANKIIRSMLAVVMLLTMTTTQAIAQENEVISIDGYTFQILNKDFDGVEIGYTDESGTYAFYLDKKNAEGKAEIIISQTDNLAKSNSSADYKVQFDENIEYSAETKDFQVQF